MQPILYFEQRHDSSASVGTFVRLSATYWLWQHISYGIRLSIGNTFVRLLPLVLLLPLCSTAARSVDHMLHVPPLPPLRGAVYTPLRLLTAALYSYLTYSYYEFITDIGRHRFKFQHYFLVPCDSATGLRAWSQQSFDSVVASGVATAARTSNIRPTSPSHLRGAVYMPQFVCPSL